MAGGATGDAGETAVGAALGGHGGEGPTADDPVPLEELSRPMAEAVCERDLRCSSFNYNSTPGGCVGWLLESWQVNVEEELLPLIEKGLFRYDAEKARACIEARRKQPCDQDRDPAECLLTFDGTVEEGGPCGSLSECAGHAACRGCPGLCVRRAELGEGCVSSNDCESGLECLEGQCVARLAEGETCNPNDESLPRCAGLMVCERIGRDMPGKCRVRHAVGVGGDCSNVSLFCEPAFACVPHADGNGSCAEREPPGGDCTDKNACALGETCDFRPRGGDFVGRCVPAPRLGERCPDFGCADDLWCAWGNTCIRRGHLGDDCLANEECFSSACIDGKCVNATQCDIEGPSLPRVLHDPPRPEESCPTLVPGRLLEGFDDEQSVAGVGGAPVSWTADERFSCSGALHLSAQLSAKEPLARVVLGSSDSEPWDWSGYRLLHLWVRLGSPGVGAREGWVSVSAEVDAGLDGLMSHSADAAHLRDFGWHELVVELPYAASERTAIESFGLKLSLMAPEDSDAAPEPTPQLDLYVDDIWLE